MPDISIAIPTYEMKGFGSQYLRELFDTINSQTFRNFEVCISDHSKDNSIFEVCEEYANYFEIKYYKNEQDRGNGPANTNSVLEMCSAKYTKLIFADDLFVNEKALEIILNTFQETNCDWCFSGFKHTRNGITFERPMIPRWTDMLLEGRNLMGSPSCVAFKTDKFLGFDPKVKLLMDTDFYYRMRCEYGMPKIIQEYLVANREHSNRVTESHNYNFKYDHPEGSWIVVKEEVDYLLEKNKNKIFPEDY